jgi:hypothetical protein
MQDGSPEAKKYNVLPLDNSTLARFHTIQHDAGRKVSRSSGS